jgi:hypothetical protein
MKYRIIELYLKKEYKEENKKVYKIQYKSNSWFSFWKTYMLNITKYNNGIEIDNYNEIQYFSTLKEAKEALNKLKQRLEYNKIIPIK